MVEGDVYIGAGETEGMRDVIRVIAPLQRLYPGIHFHLNSGNREYVEDQIQKGLLDFGLLCCAAPPVDYIYRKVSHEDVWGLFLNRENPLADKEGITAGELLQEPLIVSRQAVKSKEFDNWLGASADELNITATYNLIYNAAFMAEQGMGSLLGLEGLISENRASDLGLVFRPLTPEMRLDNYLIWKKDSAFSRACSIVKSCFDAAFL